VYHKPPVFAPYKRLILVHPVVSPETTQSRDHVFISRLSSLRKRQSVCRAMSVCGLDFTRPASYKQRWMAYSKQRFAFDKWISCRLVPFMPL
jgi:hypothetical protein